MFEKVSTDLNFVSREVEIEKFWRENDIFQKSVDQREGSDVFMFYDGPPTANGKPHIGHIETRAIKDLIPRFQTMKGKKVPRKAGWDTHGLPVELEVEKTLGLDGKEQIEEYGIAVAKGNSELLAVINEVIQELKNNGSIEKWVEDYSALANSGESNS